jgi:hypothetical protein
MQYIDFGDLQSTGDPDFRAPIQACYDFELSDIMGFRYDWNRKILAQFYATYFWDQQEDVVH